MAKKVINYETGSDLDEAIAADMAELDDLRQLAASSSSAVKPKKVCAYHLKPSINDITLLGERGGYPMSDKQY